MSKRHADIFDKTVRDCNGPYGTVLELDSGLYLNGDGVWFNIFRGEVLTPGELIDRHNKEIENGTFTKFNLTFHLYDYYKNRIMNDPDAIRQILGQLRANTEASEAYQDSDPDEPEGFDEVIELFTQYGLEGAI